MLFIYYNFIYNTTRKIQDFMLKNYRCCNIVIFLLYICPTCEIENTHPPEKMPSKWDTWDTFQQTEILSAFASFRKNAKMLKSPTTLLIDKNLSHIQENRPTSPGTLEILYKYPFLNILYIFLFQILKNSKTKWDAAIAVNKRKSAESSHISHLVYSHPPWKFAGSRFPV